MKKSFFILALFLSLHSSANAGGLFSGCMASGFGTHHSWRADTEAMISAIEADGGSVPNEAMLDALYQEMDDRNITFYAFSDPNLGVKKDGSDKVSKLYDVSGNNRHYLQTTADYQPIWTANQQNGLATLYFDGVNDRLEAGTSMGKPANFTAFTVFKTSNNTSQTALWMNRVNGVTSPYWGAVLRYNSNGDMGLLISKEAATAGYTGGRTATGIIGTTDYYLRTDRYATAANVVFIYLDGGAAESLTYAAQTAAENSGTSFDFRVGMFGDAALYYTGYIGCLSIFDSSLSDANRGYVRDFINSKYATY